MGKIPRPVLLVCCRIDVDWFASINLILVTCNLADLTSAAPCLQPNDCTTLNLLHNCRSYTSDYFKEFYNDVYPQGSAHKDRIMLSADTIAKCQQPRDCAPNLMWDVTRSRSLSIRSLAYSSS